MSGRPNWQRWWSIGAAMAGLVALAWVFWRIEYDRLLEVIDQANAAFVLVVPLAIALEQLVRAWKWRQLLYAIRPVGTLRLFGAIMAGYLPMSLFPWASARSFGPGWWRASKR